MPSKTVQTSGGITQEQLNVVNANRFTLKDFVKDPVAGGGGLFTHTLSGLVNPYLWLETLVPEVVAVAFAGANNKVNLTCAATKGFFPKLTTEEIENIKFAEPFHTVFAMAPGATNFDGLVVLARGANPDVEVIILGAPLPTLPDCNINAIPDACDLNCGETGGPCDIPGCGSSFDCNGNCVPDECDIAAGSSVDCTGNGIPDECELEVSPDCQPNGILDACDVNCGVAGGPCDIPGCGSSFDCNGNCVPDECDIAAGTSQDCTSDGIPDECEPDCNGNLVADSCDISLGTSEDCTSDGIPDECEPDCNGNLVADSCDILLGTSEDCNENGVPDECDPNLDCNINSIFDPCDVIAGDPEFVQPLGSPFFVGDFTEPRSVLGTARTVFGTVIQLDLDQDCDADLVTANQDTDDVSVFLNDGFGGFTTAFQTIFLGTGSKPHALAAGDFDNDGDLDLAVTEDNNPGNVRILLNNGGVGAEWMGFDTVNIAAISVQVFPQSIVAADLDVDQDLDLAVANQNSATVSVLFNNGMGVFSAVTQLPISVFNRAYEVAVADFDGDGRQDLSVATGGGNVVAVLLNSGGMDSGLTFDTPINYSIASGPVTLEHLTVKYGVPAAFEVGPAFIGVDGS